MAKSKKRKCSTCDGTGCPTCDPCKPNPNECRLKHHKHNKTVRVLFSIELDVPLENPNTMKEGPGPYLLGYLQALVDEHLCDVCATSDDPLVQKWDVGPFKLHSVKEV